MTENPPEPTDLTEFPVQIVSAGASFFRVHRLTNGPIYFSSDGTGRFDPPRADRSRYGTCYLSQSPKGAYVEVFGNFRPIPEAYVDERACTEIELARDVVLADLSDPANIGNFGIGADLAVGTDYELCQKWSLALFESGHIDGIVYAARHDPSFGSVSVAIFGSMTDLTRTLTPPKPGAITRISDDLVDEMQRDYGLLVVPALTL